MELNYFHGKHNGPCELEVLKSLQITFHKPTQFPYAKTKGKKIMNLEAHNTPGRQLTTTNI
jgi:hypothetical protein